MNIFQNLKIKTVKMKKYLLKEIEFHLRMLNNGTIDKDDFVNAIHEVYLHYKENPNAIRNFKVLQPWIGHEVIEIHKLNQKFQAST